MRLFFPGGVIFFKKMCEMANTTHRGMLGNLTNGQLEGIRLEQNKWPFWITSSNTAQT